ncbi:MAG: DUF1624 domain-containing protein [Actinomycetota bacterium]|nr:DUF1624 domain-containing protein [Actinomycetota bacterium]
MQSRITSRPGADWVFLGVPLTVVTALAVIYLILAPLSADHAAQTFRTELFELSGPTVWNNYWFGGHYLPTYSLLAPPIGAWIGFRVMGVLAVIGTVLLFGIIARRQWGDAARAGVVWFAVAATISLFSGRITFALGILIATAAVYAAQRGGRVVPLILAGATGLASPVAALFLACLGFSYFVSERLARRPGWKGLEVAAVAFAVSGAVALLFPGGGDEPYVWSSFVPAIGLTLVAALFVPREQRLIRTGILIYAGSLLATFLIDTPMGGNVNRLGTLLLGPLLVIALAAGGVRYTGVRRLLLVLLLVLIAVWQVYPVTRDLAQVRGEAAVESSFYRPLEKVLGPKLAAAPARVEVVPVQSHWESARAAPAFPLARGWERQTDRHLNRIFYGDRLTADGYRQWLDRLAVAWVAVPDATLDYAGKKEAELVLGGLEFLREVPVGGDWRLFRVLDPTPMADPPARLTSLTTNGFTVTSPVAGDFLVRIRQSPYFRVAEGAGCVGPDDGGWSRVSFEVPGELEIESRFSPGARFGGHERCRP